MARYEITVVSGHDRPMRVVTVTAPSRDRAERDAIRRAERAEREPREYVVLDTRKVA